MDQNDNISATSIEKIIKTENSILGDFDIGKPLGVGKFGHVFLAKTKKEGFICALKILFKKQLVKYKMEHQFVREIEIMTNLNHPNVLNLFTWFHDKSRIYLVIEYAWYGQMYTILQSKGTFSEQESATYLYQLCEALIYCHSKKVIHRDIKPENLLISHEYQLKLADFGWSVHCENMKRKTQCGTLDYFPPEIVRGQIYDERIDHWAAGVLLYEMLTGSPPFERPSQKETMEAICRGHFAFRPAVKEGARELIRKILKSSATDRLSLKGIQQHQWMQNNINKSALAKMNQLILKKS